MKLILLGATGSIGTQTLDLLRDGGFELVGISLGRQSDKLESILRRFPSIGIVSALEYGAFGHLREKYPHVRFLEGENAAFDLTRIADYDIAVNAIVGFAGLKPTLGVLERGKTLCLANKESLVVGGELVKECLAKYGGKLYPIDSEHVAIAKCLAFSGGSKVKKVILTCSGGPFLYKDEKEIYGVKPDAALAHPTWKMGKKISIDSATYMNKAFEVVEACHLFDLVPEDIEVIVNPESYVHSGLLLEDGSYLLDCGKPDMHGPIAYALSRGKKIEGIVRVKSLSEIKDCRFLKPDSRFVMPLALARGVMLLKGNAGALVNGANEEAVNLFLDGKLPFGQIVGASFYALAREYSGSRVDYDSLARYDALSRRIVRSYAASSDAE